MAEGGSESEGLLIDTAAEAVGDAMMAAQAQLMSVVTADPEKYFKPGVDPQSRTETILQVLSTGMCEVASIFSLYFLAQKYLGQFDGLGIIKSFNQKNNPNGAFKQAADEFHAYFIAKDKNGVWYAGSPANYNPDEADNSLIRVFKSFDPQEIVDKIKEYDGGEWPNGDFIRQAFVGPGYTHPSLGKSKKYGNPILHAFRITNRRGQSEAKMDELYLMTENIKVKPKPAQPNPSALPIKIPGSSK